MTRWLSPARWSVIAITHACPCDCSGDYRDDLSTTTPVPPSFHVIPETILGTRLALGLIESLGDWVVDLGTRLSSVRKAVSGS